MRPADVVILWIGFVALAHGCATVENIAILCPPCADGTQSLPPKLVYGGVRDRATTLCHLLSGEERLENRWMTPLDFGIVATDFALSAIGDTLTLPITVPAAVERQKAEAAK